MSTFKYTAFIFIFFYISNWFQLNIFIKSLFRSKSSIEIIKDNKINLLVKKKTGLNLKRIIIIKTNRLFGMMPGIPLKPEMIISEGMYKNFNKDEIEWVILHEAAHCVLWHTLKCAVIQLLIALVGIWIIETFYLHFWMTVLLAFILSLVSIKFMRHFEYEADKYSISRVNNPKGVITAQEKMNKSRNHWFYSQASITRKLLFWNILPSERIRIAKNRLKII